MADYRILDMDNYPRLEHFRYFSGLPDPTAGITAKVDVTDLVEFCKQKDCSFYLAMIHVACLAANRIPQLRQRTKNGGVIEYAECGTSHIELLPNETYCYCTLWHDMGWDEYISYGKDCREQAVSNPSISEDEDVDALYFITTLPWLSYEQISMPSTGSISDNPHFCWGKYEKDFNGRLMMPFTVHANHALVDGIHFAKFFQALQEELDGLQ